MHPMKLITYALFFAIFMLTAMGGLGFYAGYSAGRGDLEEMKTFVAASGSPENAKALAEALKGGGKQAAAPEVNLSPVLEEIRSMSAQIDKLEQAAASAARAPTPSALTPPSRDDGKIKEELAAVKQRLTAATDQYNSCRQDLSLLQVKIESQGGAGGNQQAAVQPQTGGGAGGAAGGGAQRDNASVVLYDNVMLKRDQPKNYGDVDVALSLQSITSKSAKVTVNQQAVAIAFGERKIFQHRDVTCELQLMETDLETGQAKVSIACKR